MPVIHFLSSFKCGIIKEAQGRYIPLFKVFVLWNFYDAYNGSWSYPCLQLLLRTGPSQSHLPPNMMVSFLDSLITITYYPLVPVNSVYMYMGMDAVIWTWHGSWTYELSETFLHKMKPLKFCSPERGGGATRSTEHLNSKLTIQSQQGAQKGEMLDIKLDSLCLVHTRLKREPTSLSSFGPTHIDAMAHVHLRICTEHVCTQRSK